jgi:predicted porin
LRGLLALLFVPAWAWASHPLITEDTGVLGAGRWQAELHGGRSRESAGGVVMRGFEASGVLSYGIAQHSDVQLELPYLRQESGSDVVKGRGDASVSWKWRFFERDRLSLVAKPDLYLPTGRDELGLGAGRARWGANFVASYGMGNLELLGHAGYQRNRNRVGERASLWHISVAALYAATDKLKLALDLGRDTHPDPGSRTAIRELVVGVMYALSEEVDLGLGVKHGLSDPADERAVLAGLKFRW